MNTYFTSDLHLFHQSLINYKYRNFKDVEEMNETIIARWNDKVGKNDLTYILGDITLKGMSHIGELTNIFIRLNGSKIIIRGNHDNSKVLKTLVERKSHTRVMEYYEHRLISYEKKPIFLSHYPTLIWPEQQHGSYHFYGHVHGRMDLVQNMFKNSFCICSDENDFYPFEIEEIFNKML